MSLKALPKQNRVPGVSLQENNRASIVAQEWAGTISLQRAEHFVPDT